MIFSFMIIKIIQIMQNYPNYANSALLFQILPPNSAL